MQDFHTENLLGRLDTVFVLYCCYSNQLHMVLVVDLYQGSNSQQGIPGRLLYQTARGSHCSNPLDKV